MLISILFAAQSIALASTTPASIASVQAAPADTAMVVDSCPPPAAPNSGRAAMVQAMLTPNTAFTPPPVPPRDQPLTGQAARDWPALCRYRTENAALTGPVRIVFMGDSITELWKAADPDFFTGGVVDRGISGQTSAQMVLRFQQDVVALKPRAVHIMAGTNDVAGNTGPTTEQAYKDNITAMATLAHANGIRVMIGSIPPAAHFWWAPAMKPAPQIVRLNHWLADYARRNGFVFVDYHRALTASDGSLPVSFANDGVHPNRAGYAVMQAQARTALKPYLPPPSNGVRR